MGFLIYYHRHLGGCHGHLVSGPKYVKSSDIDRIKARLPEPLKPRKPRRRSKEQASVITQDAVVKNRVAKMVW